MAFVKSPSKLSLPRKPEVLVLPVSKPPQDKETPAEHIKEALEILAEVKVSKAYPSSVTLEAPFGYIGEDGVNHYWHQGTVVTDREQIADLIARKARLV